MNISIVIPAHNEEENIAFTVEGVANAVRTPHEIIVVADHCTDKTVEIVSRLQKRYPHIRLLQNERKGSFSNAVICGLRAAQGIAVVPVMADRCDDPHTIDRLWHALEERQWDVACASRYMRGGQKSGGPFLQNIFSRAVSYTLKVLTRVPTWDCANSFKMYRRSFLEKLSYDIPGIGTEYSMALLFRAYFQGGRIGEIPTRWQGVHIPLGDELRVLNRIPGYWRWYQWAAFRPQAPLQSAPPPSRPTAEANEYPPA